jgi:hypothetical protein
LGALWIGLIVYFPTLVRAAVQPKIDYIERHTNSGLRGILIHFDAQANLTYELQYTTNLGPGNQPSGPWSNLYVAPNLPFFQHYIIYDHSTNGRARFYRLHVYP